MPNNMRIAGKSYGKGGSTKKKMQDGGKVFIRATPNT